MRANFSVSAIGALLLGALGCGLISSNITKLTFDLPKKHYVFNATSISVPPGAADIRVACSAAAPCPSPATCEADVCTVSFPISVVNKMDFTKDSQQLANYSSLANISIERIQYDVISTANVAVPPMSIYLAPLGVTSPTDPQAVKFGTVPEIPAGVTTTGDVVKEPNADATFMKFAADLTVPFNFIAATTVTWVSGSGLPTGSVDITIRGRIAAKPF